MTRPAPGTGEEAFPVIQAVRDFNMLMPGSLPASLQKAPELAPKVASIPLKTHIQDPAKYWPWPLQVMARTQKTPRAGSLKVRIREQDPQKAVELFPNPSHVPVQLSLFDIPESAQRTRRSSSSLRI